MITHIPFHFFKHTQKLFFYVLLFSFIVACKNKSSETVVEASSVTDNEFNNTIKELIATDINKLDAIVIDSIKFSNWQDAAQAIYKQADYKPIWVDKEILNTNGQQLYNFLNSAEYYALLKDKYNFSSIKNIYDSLQHNKSTINYELLKQLEQQLTQAYLNIALHLDHGMYNAGKKEINSNFWESKEQYILLLNNIIKEKNLLAQLEKLEPQHPIYKRYKEALYQFVSKNNILPNAIKVRDYKLDSIGAISDARIALKYHHYLHDTLVNNDSAYIDALKRFQKENGYKADAVLGSMTARALERDNAQKFKLLVINADRWRANKENYKNDSKYVWVNLPSYKLRVVHQDTIVKEKNVVIGKANGKNSTPEIISAIDKIVLWPTWSVPQSIIKHEMKSFKGYKVIKNGSYTQVIQPPGYRNALGTVKILFPNKHSVYIHDTPTKYLFNSDYRSHSHGCVRCQDPLEVASTLMQLDTFKFDYDSLIRLRDKKIATRQFTLKNPISVYLQYYTAEADWSGNLKFFPDVYKKDEEIINVLFNNAIYNKPAMKQEPKKDSTQNVALNAKKEIKKDTLVKNKNNDSVTQPETIQNDSTEL